MDTPHWTDSRTDKNILKNFKKKITAFPLKITNLNANDSQLIGSDSLPEPRPLHADDSVRKMVLDWQLHLLEVAEELQAPPLSFAVGALPPNMTEEKAQDLLCSHIEILVERSEALQIPLSIEFEPDHFIYSWETLKPYLQKFESPYFGVNFDIGHAACAGEDIVSTLKEAKRYINNMHFEDIQDQQHFHLVPGNGNLPLLAILDYLEEINYAKGLTVELYNHSHRATEAIEETTNYFAQHRPHLLNHP